MKLGSLEGWNEELRYDYHIGYGDVVLDIGSYKGIFSDRFKQKGASVMEFDTDTKCAWTYDGVINIGGHDERASYLYPGENYPCVDICNYLDTRIALCKINIEGGEYELMNHILGSGLQVNVDNFQIQFHKVEGYQERYDMIADRLSNTHSLTWRQPFVWENWRLG
jgi:hypothetical protein